MQLPLAYIALLGLLKLRQKKLNQERNGIGRLGKNKCYKCTWVIWEKLKISCNIPFKLSNMFSFNQKFEFSIWHLLCSNKINYSIMRCLRFFHPRHFCEPIACRASSNIVNNTIHHLRCWINMYHLLLWWTELGFLLWS